MAKLSKDKSPQQAPPKKRRSPKRKAKKTAAQKPLPPAQEVQQPAAVPEPAKPGLVDSVKNLFTMPQRSEPQEAPSYLESAASSTSEPGDGPDLRILSAVPDVIGEERSPIGTAERGDATGSDDMIASLMAQVAFEEQDVRDQLEELFEWLSERFQAEHWKLTERQSRMLGRPTAQMLTSIWAKLCTMLPDIIARWCESTPGAAAFIAACGIVIVPKAMKQVTISRQRKTEARNKVPKPHAEVIDHPFVPKVAPPGGAVQ